MSAAKTPDRYDPSAPAEFAAPFRGSKYGWLFAAIWLFYLGGTVNKLWHQEHLWVRYAGLVAVVGFAVTYLHMVSLTRHIRYGIAPPGFSRRAALGIAVLLALFGLQIPGAGSQALSCLVFIAAFGMVALPLPAGITLAVLLGGAAEALPPVVPGWRDNGYGLAVLLGSLATWGIRQAAIRQVRLSSAQQEIADLAVQNERARIASDLHDILGHSLTVVTVKAELAQRLLDVDIERARKELQDLEALARDALADVRSTAMGVRGISLPGEIAAAKEALAAANVEADLPGAADEVPSRNRELFAWTIREAVTNIVRHSKASHAQVKLGVASVEILDDGVGGPCGGGDGQGLSGLRRRAEALGARLTVGGREDEPGFRVRVEVPT
jgi:two-component system sensor histidine kinase DesK